MIRKSNWDSYHKGHIDQERHQQKINQAIRENLSDLVGEETIIHQHKFAVRVRSLHEYAFVFGEGEESKVGMGNGQAKKGDTFPRKAGKGNMEIGETNAGDGIGTGGGVGTGGADEWYEQHVSFEEVEEALFREMALPKGLEKKQRAFVSAEEVEFRDRRKAGIQSNVDKKRTLFNHLKRTGGKEGLAILKDDVVYKTWEEVKKPTTNALIFALMDTSGSMGSWEKMMARTFYFWIKRFLEKEYDEVKIVYVGHHTSAYVQTEEAFFTRGESGGTVCSTAYELMKQLMETEYPPSEYNIFGFHVSDGDNLTSDNAYCTHLLQELLPHIVSFNYLEVNQYRRLSTLLGAVKAVKAENCRRMVATDKSDIYRALKTFFPKEE